MDGAGEEGTPRSRMESRTDWQSVLQGNFRNVGVAIEAESHRLQAKADIVGKEAIALREVLASTNPGFIEPPSYFGQFFSRMGEGLSKM